MLDWNEVERQRKEVYEKLAHLYPRDLLDAHMVYCLQLSHESAELLDAVTWKPHRRHEAKVDRANLIEEAVDVLKYLTNILLLHKVSEAEFRTVYEAKHSVVLERMHNEWLQHEGEDDAKK